MVGRGESLNHACAHLERLAVIGIEVPRRQGVGAQHDATLHFCTKAGGPRGFHHGRDVFTVNAISKSNTVEASQVGAGFGRSNEVVGRQSKVEFRYRELHNGRSGILECLHGLIYRADHVFIGTIDEFADKADALPGYSVSYVSEERRRGLRE